MLSPETNSNITEIICLKYISKFNIIIQHLFCGLSIDWIKNLLNNSKLLILHENGRKLVSINFC